jgi:hypothetical protein
VHSLKLVKNKLLSLWCFEPGKYAHTQLDHGTTLPFGTGSLQMKI